MVFEMLMVKISDVVTFFKLGRPIKYDPQSKLGRPNHMFTLIRPKRTHKASAEEQGGIGGNSSYEKLHS